MTQLRLTSLALLCAATLMSGSAMARGYHGYHGHGHDSFGFYFGAPYPYAYPYAAPYYYPPYAYYPPVVISPEPPQPQVYIEQDAPNEAPPPAEPQAANVWYHCDAPEGYYPYLKDCPAGWKTVPATPPQ